MYTEPKLTDHNESILNKLMNMYFRNEPRRLPQLTPLMYTETPLMYTETPLMYTETPLMYTESFSVQCIESLNTLTNVYLTPLMYTEKLVPKVYIRECIQSLNTLTNVYCRNELCKLPQTAHQSIQKLHYLIHTKPKLTNVY